MAGGQRAHHRGFDRRHRCKYSRRCADIVNIALAPQNLYLDKANVCLVKIEYNISSHIFETAAPAPRLRQRDARDPRGHKRLFIFTNIRLYLLHYNIRRRPRPACGSVMPASRMAKTYLRAHTHTNARTREHTHTRKAGAGPRPGWRRRACGPHRRT